MGDVTDIITGTAEMIEIITRMAEIKTEMIEK